jgi:hypothetical protein
VWFDSEGAVSFAPQLSQLTEAISDALGQSIATLGGFPRLLLMTQLRPFLRDNGLDLPMLQEQGPKIEPIILCYDSLEQIEAHIISAVKQSYNRAMEQTQFIRDYYPIFRLGDCWSTMDYVITRRGTRYEGELVTTIEQQDDHMFMFFDDQPVLNFEKVRVDLVKFQEYNKKVMILITDNCRGN